jgi:hypothetical protein
MPITWFAPKPKQTADVKITKTSIVITESGNNKLVEINNRFSEINQVKLGWDPERSLVAIAPSTDEDKGLFKLSRRGRSQSTRNIGADKFFQEFGLVPDETANNGTELFGEGGVALFKVVPKPAGTIGARKKRGRVPKSAQSS